MEQGEFPWYSPGSSEMYGTADAIASAAGDVDNLSGAVDGAHGLAQDGVAGLLDGPMAHAPEPARLRAFMMMQHSMWSAGVVRLFAGHVQRYNDGVDARSQVWLEAQPHFGVDPEDENYSEKVEDAKAELWSTLEAELEDLQDDLQAGANELTWLLAAGITSEGLTLLFNEGALPIVAPAAFPGSDFMSHVDPRERWDNLIETGVLPEDIGEWSEEEVIGYLQSHPELAAEFELLLLIARPSERTLVQAYAQYHAEMVDEALGFDPDDTNVMMPHDERLDRIAEGVSGLGAVDAWVEDGGELTVGQTWYLQHWYETVGADNLAALDGHVRETIEAAQADAAEADEGLYVSTEPRDYVNPVANGIMHLSNPDVGGTDSLEAMPEAIQDLVNLQVGVVDDGLWPNEASTDADRLESAPEDVVGDGISGLDQYNGFADLMAAATAQGGSAFTGDLAESAIQVRYDLDSIRRNLEQDRFEAVEDGLVELIDDSGASTMLSVAARNEDASAAFMAEQEREELLALGWEDDDGVNEVIRAGTADSSASERTTDEPEAQPTDEQPPTTFGTDDPPDRTTDEPEAQPTDEQPPTQSDPTEPDEQPTTQSGTDDPGEQPTTPPGGDSWQVQAGDHLWSIAHAVVSREGIEPTEEAVRSYWQRLIAANQSQLVDPNRPDLLFRGQTLTLPPVNSNLHR